MAGDDRAELATRIPACAKHANRDSMHDECILLHSANVNRSTRTPWVGGDASCRFGRTRAIVSPSSHPITSGQAEATGGDSRTGRGSARRKSGRAQGVSPGAGLGRHSVDALARPSRATACPSPDPGWSAICRCRRSSQQRCAPRTGCLASAATHPSRWSGGAHRRAYCSGRCPASRFGTGRRVMARRSWNGRRRRHDSRRMPLGRSPRAYRTALAEARGDLASQALPTAD